MLSADATLCAQLASWREEILPTTWRRVGIDWICEETKRTAPAEGLAAIYAAMVLGLRDYVHKNGFPGIIIGLSGGIDSALTAAVAVDALGPDRVRCVMMPSPYTSRESLDDATQAAARLGVQLDEVSIGPAMEAFETMLNPSFGDRPPDTTEENIQARSRGLALMAVSYTHLTLPTNREV